MAPNGADGSNGEYATGSGQEKIQTDIMTLTRFLTEEQTKHKDATGDFTLVGCALMYYPNADRTTDYFARPSNSTSNRLPTTSDAQP